MREAMIGRLFRLGRPLFRILRGASICEIGRVKRDRRDLPKVANHFGNLRRCQDGRLYCALCRVRLHATCVNAELTFSLAFAFGTNPANIALLREEDLTLHQLENEAPTEHFLVLAAARCSRRSCDCTI